MTRPGPWSIHAALALAAIGAAQDAPRLELTTRTERRSGTELRVGSFRVPENRDDPGGRWLALDLIVIPARAAERAPDPVFVLAGGPGQAATTLAGGYLDSPLRARRDLVFVDQRGTGGDHRLGIDLAGSDDEPQPYLSPLFDADAFRRALPALEARADLRMYTTPIAMDDLDEVRAALGYERVNLIGGSYGTRAALIYLRRHPDRVRTATLMGVAPLAFRNPLFHARAAQDAFDALCEECRDSHPRLAAQLAAVLERLEREPADVEVGTPRGRATVTLSRDAFAEALRVLMYTTAGNRRVPRLLEAAERGDYRPFAEAGIRSNGGLRRALAFGMLMCVVGSEDLPRIDEAEIEEACRGTFLGDGRVRRQLAVGAFWPRGDVGERYGEPVTGDAPVLLLSGAVDPVTPPRFGAEAARHLTNARHVVVAAAHDFGHPAIGALIAAFVDAGSTADLDTAAVEAIRLPAPR